MHRLKKTMGTHLSAFEVIGEPKDLESARELAKEDRYQFQYWAAGLVFAQAVQDKNQQKKKGADSGIDGFIRFVDDASGTVKTIIVQVKSGHVSVRDIRELAQVVKREKAVIGVFLTLEESTKPMRDEALTEGFYHSTFTGKNYRRIQILTIEDLLTGSRPEYPLVSPEMTFKSAETKGTKQTQPKLL